MASRYDKYEFMGGGFRAPLAVEYAAANRGVPKGVGLNADGQIVVGAGQSGVVGVLILTKAHDAGHIVDVMTQGEIVGFEGDPGTIYYSDEDGNISDSDATGATRVGHTVEAARLIVRVVGGALA